VKSTELKQKKNSGVKLLSLSLIRHWRKKRNSIEKRWTSVVHGMCRPNLYAE